MNTRSAARVVVGLLLSLVALVVGTRLAAGLLDEEGGGVGQRALAVLLGVGAQLPWIGLSGALTLRSDEYAREGLYQSMGVGLGLSIVALALSEHLAMAGFIAWGDAPAAWQTVILCWGLGMLVVRISRSRAP